MGKSVEEVFERRGIEGEGREGPGENVSVIRREEGAPEKVRVSGGAEG